MELGLNWGGAGEQSKLEESAGISYFLNRLLSNADICTYVFGGGVLR